MDTLFIHIFEGFRGLWILGFPREIVDSRDISEWEISERDSELVEALFQLAQKRLRQDQEVVLVRSFFLEGSSVPIGKLTCFSKS